MFARCGRLYKVTLASGVREIGEGAFDKCVKLTEITLPSGIGRVGKNAFRGCPCEKRLKQANPRIFK